MSLSIIQRVNSLEDACKELNIDIATVFGNETDPVEQAEIAIKTVAKALREGKPESQCYFYPCFDQSSGGGISYDGYADAYVDPPVGVRLRVDTGEKAMHLGKCMLSFYKTYLTGN